MRNQILDTIKGLLIILVIFAHIVSNGPTTQHFSYLILTFFMQLFFGISGYLLTQESMQKPFNDLAMKYGYRMVIPLLFAYSIYSLIEQQLLDIFYPYTWFHLWFIVAFLMMIVFTHILEKFKINRTFTLITAVLFTLFWTGTYGWNGKVDIYIWMGHKAVYYDFTFFYIGYYLRNHVVLSDKNNFLIWFIFVFSTIYIWILNNTMQINLKYSFIWILFNLSLIYLVLLNSLNYPNIKLSFITWIGTMSLPIYLLHAIPLLVLTTFVKDGSLSPYLHIFLYFIGVGIIMFTIYITKNTRFGKLFILGKGITMSDTKR